MPKKRKKKSPAAAATAAAAITVATVDSNSSTSTSAASSVSSVSSAPSSSSSSPTPTTTLVAPSPSPSPSPPTPAPAPSGAPKLFSSSYGQQTQSHRHNMALKQICFDAFVGMAMPRDIIDIIVGYARRYQRMIVFDGDPRSFTILTLPAIAIPDDHPHHRTSSDTNTKDGDEAGSPDGNGETKGGNGNGNGNEKESKGMATPATPTSLLPATLPSSSVSITRRVLGTNGKGAWKYQQWNQGTVTTIGDYAYWCSGDRPYMRRYHIMDIDSNKHTPSLGQALAPYHYRHSYGVSCAVAHHLFLATGYGTNTCEWYNTELNKWSIGTPLTNEHSGGAAIVLNQRVHVIGGPLYDSINRACEACDPREHVATHRTPWTQLAPMPSSPRSLFGCVAIADHSCVIIGGVSSRTGSAEQDVLEYDSRMDRWFVSHRYPALPIIKGVPSLHTQGHAQLLDHSTLIWQRQRYRAPAKDPFGYYLPLHPLTMIPLVSEWQPIPPLVSRYIPDNDSLRSIVV